MNRCQACGSEISGPDRFCRNCGAPIASLVGELDDTLRFNRASARLRETEPQHPTNPFYEAPPVPDRKSQDAALTSFASLLAKIQQLPRNLIWVGLLVLLLLTASAGATIGRSVVLARRAARRHHAEEVRRALDRAKEQKAKREAAVRKSATEAIQNALGFVPADVPADPRADGSPDLSGVFVQSLTSDSSPAALAHIQAGDVLTSVNDQPISNGDDLMTIIKPLKPGSELSAKVFRDGEALGVFIKAADPAHQPFKTAPDPKTQGFLGLGDVSRRCCVPGTRRWGLEIRRIVDNSSADLAGLQDGDVIVEFDGRPVRTPDELTRRIHAAAPRSKVLVKFFRGETEQTAEVLVGHEANEGEEH